jgi:hypothetical protein
VVELFFAQGRKAIGNPIAERTLLFGAFSAGDINIPLGSIPDPPAGTTHLLAWIDRFDQVPETDEGDNVAVTTLPNLKIAPPSYDAHNRISFGYSISSAAPVTSNRYVTVDLYYARGPKLGDRLPGIPPLRSSAISFRPGAKDNFILPPGEYPLPPEDASHLLAVIDQDRQVLEADKSDNVAARAIQIAPGYKPFRLHRGVRVYVRDVNQRPAFYLTVVDLDLANMRGNLREGGISYINHHWDDLERRNTRSHELAVVINGTFFQGVGRVIPGEISLGLKYDGRIVHRGARINDPTFLNVGVLTYADDTASIIPYKASGVIDPFQLMDNARYKSLVSVLPTISDVEADRRVERTWIALRDPVAGGLVGEPRFKTVVILTAQRGVTRQEAIDEISLFGPAAHQIGQLDSSWSTGLMVDGKEVFAARRSDPVLGLVQARRPIPHALGFFFRRRLWAASGGVLRNTLRLGTAWLSAIRRQQLWLKLLLVGAMVVGVRLVSFE